MGEYGRLWQVGAGRETFSITFLDLPHTPCPCPTSCTHQRGLTPWPHTMAHTMHTSKGRRVACQCTRKVTLQTNTLNVLPHRTHIAGASSRLQTQTTCHRSSTRTSGRRQRYKGRTHTQLYRPRPRVPPRPSAKVWRMNVLTLMRPALRHRRHYHGGGAGHPKSLHTLFF